MLAPSLIKRHLEFSWIDSSEYRPGLYPLAFLKVQLQKLSTDPPADHHRVEGGHSANGPEGVVQRLFLCRGQAHGDGHGTHARPAGASPHCWRRGAGWTACLTAHKVPPGRCSTHTQHDQPDQRAPTASAR